MNTPERYTCKYCNKNTFSSATALRSHIRTSFCSHQWKNDVTARTSTHGTETLANSESDSSANEDEDQGFYIPSPPHLAGKHGANQSILQELDDHDIGAITVQMAGLLDENADDTTDESEADQFPVGEEEDSNAGTATNGPDTWIRDQFREYCSKARSFKPFSKQEVCTIRLLHLLKEKNAPMNAYESVMLWHYKESGKLHQHQNLGDYPYHIGRKTMIERLVKRYNYENKMPFRKTIKLPVSGTVVKLTVHDAKATVQRLLTDPRIEATDYLFWDGNPLASPPENLDYVEDLNTGRAFLDTYARLINPDQREQLLPVVIYFDGTAVSHFHDMEVIQVNIALGTMNRMARTKAHCWAPLGYIEKVHEQGGRGRDILARANHLETQDGMNSDSDDEEMDVRDGIGDKNDQDFHAMMSVILEDFIRLQETGMVWDHHDPGTGADTNGIHYKVFVPFLRVDGKEADLACAKYGQRSTTQQICRKCHVPLQRADDHLAKYKLKTVTEIEKLIDRADFGALQRISQTYLRNAFYEVRFSMGNDYGIHGSCPSEMLHALQLGIFKYVRDIFFELTGKSTPRAKDINALSQVYGQTFVRQSDRTMPVTAFSNGIQAGKLMAKDYRGVLLIILAIVRSTKGRQILKTSKNFKDKQESALDDWILLVEVLLEWESYLNEPQLQVKHVKRLEKKHRYIMYLMRKVAQRTKGMGLKLLKFHTIIHLWEDIIQFGVPLEYDTSANESMHKPSKKASKMTQKAADTFNFQTAIRLIEFDLLDLAMEEINNQKRIWDYYNRMASARAEDEENESVEEDVYTGDTRIKVFWNPETGEQEFELVTRSKYSEKTQWSSDVVEFLLGLQDRVQNLFDLESLEICTLHRRFGLVFRGHPNFRGKGPWKDWVWIDWGAGYGRLPSHIWCFVCLTGTFPGGQNTVHYGGIPLKEGVFAVVETANLEEDREEVARSDLLTPYLKEVELDEQGNVGKRTFYLADVEAFLDPCCMIPDFGGPANRYFVVKPRNQWTQEFIRWIQDEHILDQMDDLEEEVEESDEIMEGSEEDEDITEGSEEERPKRKRKSG